MILLERTSQSFARSAGMQNYVRYEIRNNVTNVTT